MFQYFYNSSINDCSVYRLWKAGRLWRWEGRFKDACLNEAYSEQEMLNVKGEKVEQKLAESDKTVLADGKKKRIGAGALIFPLIYSIFDAICTSASGIS